MKHLLYWHAAEEIEHKSVAFNVLQHLDCSYILRATGMLIATTLLWSFTAAGMGMFIWQDKHKNISKMPADALDFLKTIGHPAFKKFVQQWYKFFDRDFHPDQIDNRSYAERYFTAEAERYAAKRA
jgi:predicted metal-dependent hydrolase